MDKKVSLPIAPTPVGAYEAGVVRNGIGFVSGQFPLRDGVLVFTGQVGGNLTLDQDCEATEIAALNVGNASRTYSCRRWPRSD